MGSRGPKWGAWWGSGASAMPFGGKFIKQKLLGTPNLVGVGHLMGPQIQILFWSHGHSLSRGVYNTKVVVNVPKSAWPQGQGIGLEGAAGPWKANVWLSHIL